MHAIWNKSDFADALKLRRQSLDYRITKDASFPEPFGISPDGSSVFWCPDLQPEVAAYVAAKVSQGRGRMHL